MNRARITVFSAVAVLAVGSANVASAAAQYDQNFLPDYSKLVATPLPNNAGTDLVYVVPGAFDKLGYTAVMIDQPEILISPSSPYDGAKPADLTAVAELVRKAYSDALKAGGYGVVETPGSNVLYLKLAITDLSLKRKKRPLLAYTPVGFVLKAGIDATRDMMEKYDILGAAIQGEVLDSTTNTMLAEFVGLRGNNYQRLSFDQLDSDIKGAASKLRCRLDNTHVAPNKRIDCLDAAARAAREAAGPVPH